MLSTPVVTVECTASVLVVLLTLIALVRDRSTSAIVIAILSFLFGSAVGLYCAFEVRWSPSDTITYVGFPVPIMVLRFEDGRWVDYIGGPGPLLGVPMFAAASQLPVLLWLLLRRRTRSSTEPSADGPPNPPPAPMRVGP